MKSKTKIGLILAAIMITVVFNSGCITDAPPKEFRALYYELLSQMTEFENSLPAPTNENHDPVFAAELLTANSNRGEDLLQPGGIIGAFLELDRLEELGVEGVVIAVNFPLFYPPFHENSSEQEAYLDFYKEVAESVNSRGMKLIIENNFIFTQEGISTFNLTDFYNGLSLAEYLSGRLQTVITIADELHPDYLTIVIEPDTEEAQTGKPVNDVTIQTEYVNDVLAELENNNITDVKIGAGVGTWHPQYNAFITSFAATNIDYIDTHIYPINRDFFERVLTIADIAQSNGKSITMSETWLYKTAETELGSVTETELFARDVFSFWAPLDRKFLEVITKLAYAKEFEFISPFWTKYFFAYLDYGEVSGKSSEELIALSSAEAGKNIVAGKFTSTGLKYKELINEFSNNSPVKSITTIKEYGKSLDWSHAKNLIAFGKHGTDGYYDVCVMEPDGSDEQCLTCDKEGCPQKHNGCPTWHPSGDFIVFTAEKKENLKEHKEWAIPGTGFNCDLWVMTSDGENFYQLTDYPIVQPWKAIIHPQFSHDGKKLFWAERIEQGESLGGGWVLKIADFAIDGIYPHLENISICEPGEQSCFYESHAFSKDDKSILFSGNLKSGQSVSELDIYELNIETNQLKRLTTAPNEWDEHAHYSPDGKKIAWMSSAEFDIEWGNMSGHNWQKYLVAELWLMNADGSNRQRLTYFNEPDHLEYMDGKRCVVSDSVWSPDGKKIVALVAYESLLGMRSKIVMIEFE